MHIYEKDGKKYPSVTTVLKLIDTNESLLLWANMMGLKKRSIIPIQNEALVFGTKVHAHLQHEVDPEYTEKPVEEKNKFLQYDIDKSIHNFKNLFRNISFKTIFTEKTLYDDKHQYAGTLDWFVEINGKKVLVDFKTSKKPYEHYKLQLGGYSGLLDAYYGKSIVDLAAIIICNTKEASMHPINRDTLSMCQEAFLSLLDFYHKKEKIECNNGYDYSLIEQVKKI